jgi:hypothetical protein
MHKRQQIREFVEQLLTGSPVLGARVFSSRVYPLNQDEMPGVCIYTEQEESNRANLSGTLHRNLFLKIDGYVTGTDIDDQCDDIAEQVELQMAIDKSLGGLVLDSEIRASEISLNMEGADPYGIISLSFEILYETNEV